MKHFDHKNIVKLLGVCTRGEPVYAVMEFMLHGMCVLVISMFYLPSCQVHVMNFRCWPNPYPKRCV